MTHVKKDRFRALGLFLLLLLSLYIPSVSAGNETRDSAYIRSEGLHQDEYVGWPDCTYTCDKDDWWKTTLQPGDEVAYTVSNLEYPAMVELRMQCHIGTSSSGVVSIHASTSSVCTVSWGSGNSYATYGYLHIWAIDGWGGDDTFYNLEVDVDTSGRLDSDNDRYYDYEDAFPYDATQWNDIDGDGYGDNPGGNNPDAFPEDYREWVDSDGDGFGDNSDQCPNSSGTSLAKVQKTSVVSPRGPSLLESWLTGVVSSHTESLYGNNSAILDDSWYIEETVEDEFLFIPAGMGSLYRLEPHAGCSDGDADGVEDTTDMFPNNPAQWVDSDGDGFGDNTLSSEMESVSLDPCVQDQFDEGESIPAWLALGCIAVPITDTQQEALLPSTYSCEDGTEIPWSWRIDGIVDCSDGSDEKFVYESSYDASILYTPRSALHTTGIDVGFVLQGNGLFDACPLEAGLSFRDRVGCIDTDGDGWSDLNDAFPQNATEWYDTDADGVGDNADVFPLDASESRDDDSDGFGNNEDVFPFNESEWSDQDLDGVGDNADVFPLDEDESRDDDLDGVGNNADAFPNEISQITDLDKDGYGDNQSGFQPDACPGDYGQSFRDRFGCPDSNLDGFSDANGVVNTVFSKAGEGEIPALLTLILPVFMAITAAIAYVRKKNPSGTKAEYFLTESDALSPFETSEIASSTSFSGGMVQLRAQPHSEKETVDIPQSPSQFQVMSEWSDGTNRCRTFTNGVTEYLATDGNWYPHPDA